MLFVHENFGYKRMKISDQYNCVITAFNHYFGQYLLQAEFDLKGFWSWLFIPDPDSTLFQTKGPDQTKTPGSGSFKSPGSGSATRDVGLDVETIHLWHDFHQNLAGPGNSISCVYAHRTFLENIQRVPLKHKDSFLKIKRSNMNGFPNGRKQIT